MRAFAELYEELDTTNSTNLKLAAVVRYLRAAEPADAAWAIHLLSGRKLARLIGPAQLRRWLIEASPLPAWLIEETLAAVGDLAESIALLVDEPGRRTPPEDLSLTDWIEGRLLPLRGLGELDQRRHILGWWQSLPYRECFLLNKLLTGALRVGVSHALVTRALGELAGESSAEMARRLMGEWTPSASFWRSLLATGATVLDPGSPFPFFLASALEQEPAGLGPLERWLVEWKWDGIRAQLVRRSGRIVLWSRGEELITERFPEIVEAAGALPSGTVLDGELVAWRDGVLPFAELQQRIGRKSITRGLLERVPVHYLVYDLLEREGQDFRGRPLRERRAALEGLIGAGLPRRDGGLAISVSPRVEAESWDALALVRAGARERCVEGLMLKDLESTYGVGRQRGAWWKWKIEPHSFDAVMLYAHPGHGRRSNLYTDYTFGVWRGEEIVPVAKAYSGLTDREILELDRWIRAHTRERFGPTRSVEATQVFELACEGVARSTRHKSGVALRFPRILRWRRDKPAREANTLADLEGLIRAREG